MQTFACGNCGHLVFFENSICLRCGRSLGFVADGWTIDTFDPHDQGDYTPHASADGAATTTYRRCANAGLASCNWMVATDDVETDDGLCVACRLTRTRPNDDDVEALAAFARAEAAKRRLVYQLHDLDLPIVSRVDDPEAGLAFDLLSSRDDPIVTGHDEGVITIDLAESDDAHRTKVQQQLGEAYRTMLGHFRHEIGHYYWGVLVGSDRALLAECRALFGDDEADYADAIDRHYRDGPPAGWAERYVSSYATMHPYEDWAETFAHYLHIRDSLETAAAYRLMVGGPVAAPAPELIAVPAESSDPANVQALLDQWLPLTYALNAINRSMGKDDLYPFVLAKAVVAKLAFVHQVVTRSGTRQ